MIAFLLGLVLVWDGIIPRYKAAPGSCSEGSMPIARPCYVVTESVWAWKPLWDTVRVEPGDTLRWRYGVQEYPSPLWMLRRWLVDGSGLASCSTMVLKRPVQDSTPPAVPR